MCSGARWVVVVAGFGALGLCASDARALTPVPRVYYDFEKITGGEYFENVIAPGTFDGYLGTSPSDTVRHPAIVAGLHGSSTALKFNTNSIARVPALVTDANADRIDEDVFAGAFTVFARIDPPNVSQMNVVNADRGPLTTTVRGWYMDTCYSTQNAQGEYLLGLRLADGAGHALLGSPSETSNYKNVDSYAITYRPSSNPGVANDGLWQIFINGLLYTSASHNYGPARVGEAGFNIGYGEGVSWGQGIVIDDLAVWDRLLSPADLLEVHTLGVTTPEPTALALLALGVLGILTTHRKRRGAEHARS